MLTPMPTQRSGAEFLARHDQAALFDQPRVGKTGAAIMAADYRMAQRIAVVTTASGRAVWRRAFRDWSCYPRNVHVYGVDRVRQGAKNDVVIASWEHANDISVLRKLGGPAPDLILLDEAHYAANPAAARTQATYGRPFEGGRKWLQTGLVRAGDPCWLLTGSPLPHDPSNIWTHLSALAPHVLAPDAARGWPDVTRYDDFRNRYCIVGRKKLNWRSIEVVIGGRTENLAELRKRLKLFPHLLRTQADIGLRPPSFETLPLIVDEALRAKIDGDVDARVVLAAAERGDTDALEYQLGALRQITGKIVAEAALAAVKTELDNGMDKIVLMRWHSSVGRMIHEALGSYGVATIDGSTSPREREAAEMSFRRADGPRVIDAQILAAGEAIDLSAAANLWYLETSFRPKDMSQSAMRIVNVEQKRNCFVKVCTIEGTIYDAVQSRLIRLWSAIREVLK